MNKVQMALELRRALQIFLAGLDAQTHTEKMLQVSSVFPAWQAGRAYTAGEVLRYGVNAVGDAQLYQALQAHTAAAEWTPDASTSLYKKIGVGEDGTPVWTPPLGAADAYGAGDVVLYGGAKYRSVIDGNVWAPDAYPAGWEAVV